MDQELKDANTMLAELEKGLVSQNVGEQCEAVVKFTSLFQRYPFPAIINNGCLKLAEAFRCGSNFIRIQICRVFERNQHHITKITSIEDIYRNMFTVTTSNDPYARLITLMTMGNMAFILHNYRSIHHCIRSSLDSSTEFELSAALYSASCFVKQSSEFACNIYPKIMSFIDKELSTEMKIKALAVLDHGFYNSHDAMQVRSYLVKMVHEPSKTRKFICAALTLSTRISLISLSYITPQIDLLLDLLKGNEDICMIALNNLAYLAEKSPHIWETSQIDPLLEYFDKTLLDNSDHKALESDKKSKISETISILVKLMNCKCNSISLEQKDKIQSLCRRLASDERKLALSSMGFEL